MGLVRTRYVRAGVEPRPYGIGQSQARIKSKRLRRFTFSQRLLEEMESCFSIDDVSRYF